MSKVTKKSNGMVDVTQKNATKRKAIAISTIVMGKKAFNALLNDECPKGNVLETARVAAVMGAKLTPQNIPFCHPLEIGKIEVNFNIDKKACSIHTTAEVHYIGKTGVEMEALCAVNAAALTIYDMMKWADHSMVIKETKLLHKSGGKTGTFER